MAVALNNTLSTMSKKMEKAYLFEVETTYKSGKKRTEIIPADTETEMWQEYDRRHDNGKVASSVIVDSWIQ